MKPLEKKCLVSIIVPVYNVALYLEKCLDSLVTQSLTDIEIIVVNDGSTDKSKEIIEKYTLQYPKLIRAYHQKNTGPSGARNFGIKQAKGIFIGFVDGDDWIDSKMYEEMYTNAITTDSEIVVCPYIKIDLDKKTTIPIRLKGKIEDFGVSVDDNPNILYASRAYAWNKLYHKRLFSNEIEPFPLGQWYEDSATIYGLLKKANKVSCVNKPFYNYRFNRDRSITKTLSPKIFDIFKSFEAMQKQFKFGTIKEKKLRNILEKLILGHIFGRYTTFAQLNGLKDKELAYRFVSQSFDYLNKQFPNWKKNYKMTERIRLSYLLSMRFSKSKFYLYLLMPKTITNWDEKKTEKRTQKRETLQKRNLRKYGYSVLKDLKIVFGNISLQYFADFSTLLGFIREGDFVSHDLDLGVFADEKQKIQLRAALDAAGYKLWRSYILDDKIVKQSYHLLDENKNFLVKFDLNFYENTTDSSKAWLLYRAPTSVLLGTELDVLEMTYSKIEELTQITINNLSIPIPKNAKNLLTEKYGKEWRSPDSDWNHGESPAAKLLEKTGHFVTKLGLSKDHIKLLQNEQLKILDTFKILCEKEELNYFLGEGTLLGAVRHQGYVPWDDGIDILMRRNDYEKLLALPKTSWPEGVLLWYHTTDPKYHLPFARIVSEDHANFRNTFLSDIEYKFSGPRINIFPLDTVPKNNPKESIKRYNELRKLRTLLMIKRDYPVADTKVNKNLSLWAPFISVKKIHKLIYAVSTKFNTWAQKNPHYIVNSFSSYNSRQQVLSGYIYGKKPTLLEFEGTLHPVPTKYHKVLTKIYGDYMTPPPENNRVSTSHFMIYDDLYHLNMEPLAYSTSQSG